MLFICSVFSVLLTKCQKGICFIKKTCHQQSIKDFRELCGLNSDSSIPVGFNYFTTIVDSCGFSV